MWRFFFGNTVLHSTTSFVACFCTFYNNFYHTVAAENGEVVYKKYLYACVARWYAFTAAEVTKAIPSPDEAEVVETEASGEVSEKAFKSGGFWARSFPLLE